MIEYVCGFLFGDRGRVALIHKARPAWQQGKLNGIGGKIEPGETARQAMVREFREETGYFTFEGDWSLRVIHRGPGHVVYFFRADRAQTVELRYDGEEPCEWVDGRYLSNHSVVPNLHWLIPLCLDDALQFPIEIFDRADPAGDGIGRPGEGRERLGEGW